MWIHKNLETLWKQKRLTKTILLVDSFLILKHALSWNFYQLHRGHTFYHLQQAATVLSAKKKKALRTGTLL